MRLSLKYPGERVVLSWDFSHELSGHACRSMSILAQLDRASPIKDEDPTAILSGDCWMEEQVVFQVVRGGIHGADYWLWAIVERDDGLPFQKLSVLPVRNA